MNTPQTTDMKIPVYVYPKNPLKTNIEGLEMIACFTEHGLHVCFMIVTKNGHEHLANIKNATSCDGTCLEREDGLMLDFFEQPNDETAYDRRPLIAKAIKEFSK